MGGKDSSPALSRASRDAVTSSFPASRITGNTPFYRQFLPAQLSNISANDPIPTLDELSALAKHLGRIKTESAARLSRLESRPSDPFRPLFFSAPNDLFSPPGLPSAALSLYSDSTRQTPPISSSSSSLVKHHKSRERSFASPAPSASASAPNGSSTVGAGALSDKNKVKIKRERDNDTASASSSLYSDARSPNKLGGAAGKANPRSKVARGHSLDIGGDDESIASTDPDWGLDEDSITSRPGRTYAKNKKRKYKDVDADSHDDESGSEFEAGALLGTADSMRGASTSKHVGVSTTSSAARSAVAAAAAGGPASRRGSEVGTSSGGNATSKIPSIGMRLKANTGTGSTAAQTPPGFPRKASDGTQVSTRRNSVLPSPSPLPSTPLAQPTKAVMPPPIIYQPAPGWELPARTPKTFMPVLEKSRKPRAYPTKPSEVMENFADKDWKEKERERDRLLERESVGPGTPGGPGPGQSLVKEASTGRRGGRDLQQTPINTFYNYADAFFKTLTEDDLAWLSHKSDDQEPFQMPVLGRHYREIWDEEDALLASGAVDVYGNPLSAPSRSPSISLGVGGGLPLDVGALAAARNGKTADQNKLEPRDELEIPPPPHFRVKQMTDQHLGLESPADVDARSGPLAERLVASLLPPHKEGEEEEDKDPNASTTGLGGGSRSALPPTLLAHVNGLARAGDEDEGDGGDADGEADVDCAGMVQDLDMASFEDRIAKELKALEVLGADEKLDWASRGDDEISTTLRMVQRELARQQKVNEMRKDRLFGIAKDRMAYQDYVHCLNSVEKEIEAGWTKRLRQIKASLSKRKKGGGHGHHDDPLSQVANGVQSASGTPQPGGAAYSGVVRPQLPESLVSAMDQRHKLQYAFRELFDEAKHAWQTPSESVYADLHLEQVK
ncbi:uncharacterized protein MEPE_06028 [Melanopsichium pennsylvanicum]|uniref:Histone acetyltransferases subunit 3-domain-containing protein n=2 Tax=Melanopsichium pennsylvanicum TaxID=63383 RepID=A0AAJ4XS46_9BASI|nr:conserved hypothetical protein [Melanopsichium pennsylvanicum 4]SNX87318.1 uncharacterized protein MEPE_06028 [Melanopsichium pennsylvanicum]